MWLILTTPFETHELRLVDLVASEQFSVVAEVAQKPVQLPQGLRVAIEPARKGTARKATGLKNGQSERVVRFWGLPTKMDSLHPNQEDSVGDLVGSTAIGGVQACDLAFHAAPSFWAR